MELRHVAGVFLELFGDLPVADAVPDIHADTPATP